MKLMVNVWETGTELISLDLEREVLDQSTLEQSASIKSELTAQQNSTWPIWQLVTLEPVAGARNLEVNKLHHMQTLTLGIKHAESSHSQVLHQQLMILQSPTMIALNHG